MAYVDKLIAPSERIVLRTHRHRLVLIKGIGVALLVLLAGVAAVVYLTASGQAGPGSPLPLLLGAGGVLLALLAALPAYLRWRSEEYVVTDRRVLQSEGLFAKRVLDSSLDKVNDVLLTQSLFGRLLDFGTLQILTASEVGINRLDWIPRPLEFKSALLEAKRPLDSAAAVPAALATPLPAAPRDAAAARLEELEDLKRRGLVSDDEYRDKRADIISRL